MSDDITYSGSGKTVPGGTKQVTDAHATRGHMPVVKLAYSADGSANLAQVDADGLLVNLGPNNDVTVAGVATAANQATEIAGLVSIDAHVDGLEAKADTGNVSLAQVVASTLW